MAEKKRILNLGREASKSIFFYSSSPIEYDIELQSQVQYQFTNWGWYMTDYGVNTGGKEIYDKQGITSSLLRNK